MSGARAVVAISATTYWRRWSRSRGVWGFLAFVGVLCWYDLAARDVIGPTEWYQVIVFLAAWIAVLAGYDTIGRMRDERSLRLLLLRSTPRAALAVGIWLGATAVVVGSVLIAIAVFAIAGRLPSTSEVVVALPVLLIGAAGFVAYAQAASVVLPRDTAAVLCVMALIFGGLAPERWIPANAPAYVGSAMTLLWNALPTSLRLSTALDGPVDVPGLTSLLLYPLVGLTATSLLLRLPRLLRRPTTEAR